MAWGQPRNAMVPRAAPRPRSTIPMEHKAACYYFGLDPLEIVELKNLVSDGKKIWVHLRSIDGELEWKGNLDAPPWQIPMPKVRVADLVAQTKDCPTCQGSGKVAKTDAKRVTPK